MAVPTNDRDLVPYSLTFSTYASSDATSYGLTTAQAAHLATLRATYFDCYSAAVSDGMKSKYLVTLKNSARQGLLDYLRELYSIVQINPAISDALKVQIGVLVKKTEPTPVPVPGMAPRIAIVGTNGRTVRVAISNPDAPEERRLPRGVILVNLFSFVGETAPAGSAGWKFETSTAKRQQNVTFAPTVAEGARVWFTAFYLNSRKQSGPATPPISAYLSGGSTELLAA